MTSKPLVRRLLGGTYPFSKSHEADLLSPLLSSSVLLLRACLPGCSLQEVLKQN